MKRSVVLLLSGGMDSTICMFWAIQQGWNVHALTVNYGQVNSAELAAAKYVARMAGVKSHRIVEFGSDVFGWVQHYSSRAVYIPGRNLFFVLLGSSWAVVLNAQGIVMGVDGTAHIDRSCRLSSVVKSLETVVGRGIMGKREVKGILLFPLASWVKAQSVKLATELPGCLEALAYTCSCSSGHARSCGYCDACLRRAEGFEEAGIVDPLRVGLRIRLRKEL